MGKTIIISSGSHGNAVLYDNDLLIDCGVGFNKLVEYNIKYLFITHIHSDHLNIKTANKLYRKGVKIMTSSNDVYQTLTEAKIVCTLLLCGKFSIGKYIIETFKVEHDVETYGIRFKNLRNMKYYIHATDFANIEDLPSGEYDEINIEANYDDENEVRLDRSLVTHNSFSNCSNFISMNIAENGTYNFLHISRYVDLGCD